MSSASLAFNRATYPLARALQEAFGSNISQVKKRLSPRFVNIVHEQLCDDVLARIGPSLERHRGCTIIDINPGAGLWSAKIHQFLKPKHHLLLEHSDRFDAFKPFIRPLLKPRNSRYRHLSYHEERSRWAVMDGVTEALRADGLWPVKASTEPSGTSSASQDSILILANMSAPSKAVRKVHLSDEPAEKFLRSFCLDLAYGRGLHTTGPVRLLMWANDSAKRYLQPRDLATRSSYEMQREELVDVSEVASADFYPDNGRRNPTQDLRRAIVVAGRMASAGLQTPSHRETLLGKAATEFLPHTGRAMDSQWPTLLPELEDLEQRHAAGHIPVAYRARHDAQAQKDADRDLRTSLPNPEFERLVQLRDQIRTLLPGSALDHATPARVTGRGRLVAEIEAQRIALELQLARDGISAHADMLAELSSLDARADALVSSFHHQDLFRGFSVADNAASVAIDPPLLSWDRRRYEPLAVADDEFWPCTPLALHDFDPLRRIEMSPEAKTSSSNSSSSSSSRSSSSAHQPVCHHPFIRTLTKRGGDDVVTALERTGPGTVDALFGEVDALAMTHESAAGADSMVEALTDPQTGGRRRLRDLRVRMLRPAMLRALYDAWATSPFTGGGRVGCRE